MAGQSTAAFDPSSANPQKVLVVDDDEAIRSVVHAHLTDAGYATRAAADGSEALVSFEAWQPDLVLLDVLMPGMDGFLVCRRMRSIQQSTEAAIVFLTGLDDPVSHQRALDAGADDFLSKPIQRTELLMRVRSLLWVKQLKDELRRNYELIREQRDALLTARRRQADLTQLVVHDLKNPLTSILANTEILLDDPPLPPDEAREALVDVHKAASAMRLLVLNLLDISRSEDGVLALQRADVDLGELIVQARRLNAPQAQARGVRLEFEGGVEGLRVHADPELLRRVLDNLIENAVRHTPNGGEVTLQAQLVPGEGVLIRVRDAGPGIPEEQRLRVFEKYFQLRPDEGGPNRRSRGLGLTFCRLAAEQHGGRIWIEDSQPRGATFCVLVPAAVEEPATS